MKIGGFQEISLLEYPDTISAIIWTIGCNFRCPFCYNRQLVFEETQIIDEKEIFAFLEKRKDKLEALSISGGEPLIHDNIFNFLEKVKKFNYLIKIDTNGSFPTRLKNLINRTLVDYVSMDVKAPKYRWDINHYEGMISQREAEEEYLTDLTKILSRDDIAHMKATTERCKYAMENQDAFASLSPKKKKKSRS